MRRPAAILVAALLVAAGGARAAARLDYRGSVLSPREVEALAAPALRAPGDSSALAEALGRVATRLQALGYLEARVAGGWTPDRASLALSALEGPLHRVRELRIEAPDAADSAAFAAALPLRVGDVAAAEAVGAAGERALRAVAGAGTGSTPCAAFTVPRPRRSVEKRTSVAPRCSSPAAAPTMSAMASSAPTSWK